MPAGDLADLTQATEACQQRIRCTYVTSLHVLLVTHVEVVRV
jgi:hypothetical protein